MLVVMLLLLMVTATAMFAVNSTSTEIRASGYARQRIQTRYIAEGALAAGIVYFDAQPTGADGLRTSLEESTRTAFSGGTSATRYLAPEEPPMAGDRPNHRMEVTSFTRTMGAESPPIVTTAGAESLGGGLGISPEYVIDANDEYRFTGVVAGQRSDGNGTLEYVAVTYTARGRARLRGRDGASPLGPTDTTDPRWRGYHETVSNARATTVAGPTRRRGST